MSEAAGDHILSRKRPLAVAHRGASALAPENTLAAFSTALEIGVDLIETDVHPLRTGELVCIHDETLDRTTDGSGSVGALSLEELRRLDAGAWLYPPGIARPWGRAMLRVPTLAEVLELARGRAGLLVELKHPERYPGIEERLLAELKAAGALDHPGGRHAPVLQSFDAGCVRRLAALAPSVRRYQLIPGREEITPALLDEAATYAHGIGPYWMAVSSELVGEAHARRLSVQPYTVNAPDAIRSLVRMGVDGIISDNPVELKRVLREETGQPASPNLLPGSVA